MTPNHETSSAASRLATLLDDLSAGCDADFDAAHDDIEREFQLNDDRLFSITQQLIDDFRLGLREYNHSMAMMYAETRPAQSKTR